MPRQTTKGMVQIGVEIPVGLFAALTERCARLRLTKADEVRLALRRHLAYPPEDVIPPLPDAAPIRKRARRGKSK